MRVYTTNDGVRLVADVSGDPGAPCVVMLHGGGQTRHSWSRTTQALADVGYYVISYDARGHGDSSWSPDGTYSFTQRARDLRVVLSDVHGPFALVGASMGGVTALQAVVEGLSPAAVVLADIVLRPQRSGVERIVAFMTGNPDGFSSLTEAVEAVAAYNPNRSKPATPGALMRNLRVRPDGRLRWHWDPKILSMDLEADLAVMSHIMDGLPAESEMPVLLIRGEQSDLLTDANVAEFRAHMKGTETVTVAGAGHMVAGDNNSVFQQGVVEFLTKHL